jgi:hypothetical protein
LLDVFGSSIHIYHQGVFTVAVIEGACAEIGSSFTDVEQGGDYMKANLQAFEGADKEVFEVVPPLAEA